MTAAPPERLVLACAGCPKTVAVKPTPAGQPRTPAGWKHHQEKYWCPVCWRGKYILRAVTVPVSSPLESSWEELRAALKSMWVETTRCANWMTTELYARDVRRNPGDEKLAPMPRAYLYPQARVNFPALPPQTVAALEQTTQRKYRANRYDLLWTNSVALPTYRYPTPFPVPNQGWYTELVDNGQRPVVNLRIGEGRYRLRLKGGPQFRRQRRAFDQLHGGAAIQGEAAIYPDGPKLMVKLVGWLPREAQGRARSGVLHVRTDPHRLLVALNAKDETLWNYNGDHLVRWAAEHREQLQRWSEDAKYENRPVPTFAERRALAAAKFRRRMNSGTHEIAAQLAGYADRRHFATVRYDDTGKRSCEEFPWFRLRTLLAEKLDAKGIGLELPSEEPPAAEPGPLAEGKDDDE